MGAELLLADLEVSWRGPQASGECPFGCGTRNAFGVRMDGPEMDAGVFNCLKCGESGFVRDGQLYRRGERASRESGVLDRVHRRSAWSPAVEAGAATPAVASLLDRAFASYCDRFSRSPGERYLRARGFQTAGMDVGYAPGGQYLLDRGIPADLLWNLGLIRADGSDFLERRVVLRYRWQGRTACLFGRAVEPAAMRHLYTRTSGRARGDLSVLEAAEVSRYPWLKTTGLFEHWRWNRGVYAEAALSADGVLLVEGALDAEAANQLGAGPAVAIGGAGARRVVAVIRPDQAVRIGTDNDPAGEKAFERLYGDLIHGRTPGADRQAALVTRVRAPGGQKDWAAALAAGIKVAIS